MPYCSINYELSFESFYCNILTIYYTLQALNKYFKMLKKYFKYNFCVLNVLVY